MLKRLIFICILVAIAIIFFAVYSWYIVETHAKGRVFDDVQDVPETYAGLLLGTSPTLADGRNNLFYLYRIRATTELLNAGKAQKIVVSGDNRSHDYNEPEYMTNDLVKKWFSQDSIHQDYAWIDTLDSVLRMNTIFQQEKFVIISQDFHVKRAIYLGKKYDLDVYGYVAQWVSLKIAPRVYIREIGARMKAVINVMTWAEPKFWGEVIEI